MGFDFGPILKVREATQEGERNGDETECSERTGDQTDGNKIVMKSREESLEEIRGLLKDQLPGRCSVSSSCPSPSGSLATQSRGMRSRLYR